MSDSKEQAGVGASNVGNANVRFIHSSNLQNVSFVALPAEQHARLLQDNELLRRQVTHLSKELSDLTSTHTKINVHILSKNAELDLLRLQNEKLMRLQNEKLAAFN